MDDDNICVEDQLFLGREQEQDEFRRLLAQLAKSQAEDPPTILLLYGEGGMGKTQLLRRCRDIARDEEPFARGFRLLDIDWEAERTRSSVPFVRTDLRPETVLDILCRALTDAGWADAGRDYRQVLERQTKLEQRVAAARERTLGATQDAAYPGLRKLSSEALAALLRRGTGVSGQWQQPIAEGLDEVLVAGADALHEARAWLRSQVKLTAEEEALFRDPSDARARALGAGLLALARSQPLLVLLDTYEIVDRVDPWLRRVMSAAGGRVLWLLAGRDNLRDSRAAERFVGYSAELPRRLTAWDLRELAIDDVARYVAWRAPERPLARGEAEALQQATQGVPLAIHQAADLWAQGVALAAIVGQGDERVPRDQIVRRMSERSLLHCDNDDDRRALYLLAMQRRPDADVQHAVMCEGSAALANEPRRVGLGPRSDLGQQLARLARTYSAVRLEGGARLHAAVGGFLREFLLTAEPRASALLQQVAHEALACVERQRALLERELTRLEERCQSEDWRELALDALHWRFWIDARAAQHEASLCLLDGLGYAPAFTRAVAALAANFAPGLSRDGSRWLAQVREGLGGPAPDGARALLALLQRALERAASDAHVAERRAILALLRGEAALSAGRLAPAYEALTEAEAGLPSDGIALRQRLASAFNDLAGQWSYRDGRWRASLGAERCARHATSLSPEDATYWNRLSLLLSAANKRSEALATADRAIAADPSNATYHANRATALYNLSLFDEALNSALQAARLAPNDSHVRATLGWAKRKLKRYGDALADFGSALELEPNNENALCGQGWTLLNMKRHDQALADFTRALELQPDFVDAPRGRGWTLCNMKRYDEALADFTRALELEPDDIDALRGRGRVLWELARWDDAEASLRHASKDDDANAWNDLGVFLICRGRRNEGRQALEHATQVDDRYPLPHKHLGVLALAEGDLPAALAHIDRALALDPSYGSAQVARALCLQRLGQHDEAANRLAAARPLIEHEDTYYIASLHAVAGETEQALRRLAEANPLWLDYARWDPAWDALRADPRLVALLATRS